MFQNANAGGAQSAPPDPLADEEGLAAPLLRTPPPLQALWASFLQVSGSNPLQSWHPTNDRFQMCIQAYMKFVFSALENGENGLSNEGAEGGGNAPQNFWARTAPADNEAMMYTRYLIAILVQNYMTCYCDPFAEVFYRQTKTCD